MTRILDFKVSQNGLNAPELIIFENTLGAVTPLYSQEGIYFIEIAGVNLLEADVRLEYKPVSFYSEDLTGLRYNRLDVYNETSLILTSGFEIGALSDSSIYNHRMTVIVKDKTPYNDSELSAISHAQSILYRAGLKELALSIGAPRPKKP